MATPPMSELNWAGFATKKAFKSATKQSWKRRWCIFDAEHMSISWAEAEGRPPKGSFVMDPTDLRAEVTTDHGRDNEIVFTTGGSANSFYVSMESAAEAVQLLTLVDAAKRLHVCAQSTGGYKHAREAAASIPDASTADASAKIFAWGVATVMGCGDSTLVSQSMPRRLAVIRSPQVPTFLSAGPEHAGVVTSGAEVFMWGSNEFKQVAAPPDTNALASPMKLAALLPRKVIALACGGSHTLAIVSDVEGVKEGSLIGWGTGTVGQLGLGETSQMSSEPVLIPMPGTALTKNKPALVSRVFAGLVTSAAVTNVGELFVWGDASLGRLGLPTLSDTTPHDGMPVLVNAQKVWLPTQLTFSHRDVDADAGAKLSIADVALGGSFSIFLINTGKGRGSVMLVSGGLGIDITRDAYGYSINLPEADIQKLVEKEIKGIPRRYTPLPVTPFERQPVILAAFAGARHAAVIVADESRGGAPRLYTAGKGWLGHTTAVNASSRLLKDATLTTYFAPVAGALDGVDVVEAACGHSHTIVRTADNRLFAWGRGDSGELGQSNLSDHTMPVAARLIDGHTWTQVGAGSYYSTGIATVGSLPPKSFSDVLSDFQRRVRATIDAEAAARAALEEPPEPEPEPEPEADDTAAAEEDEDPNALPKGWDYEYDDEGAIYFICPHGETTWDDPREGPKPVRCSH